MATVQDIIDAMQDIAHESAIYNGFDDNVGLLLGNRSDKVRKVLCCLDVTSTVVDEAIKNNINLIVSHHPMIFAKLSSITYDTPLGRNIIRLCQHNIAVYSSHTNLDFVQGGINCYIAQILGLQDTVSLKSCPQQGVGLGRVGNLVRKKTARVYCLDIARQLGDNSIRLIGDANAKIERVAVVNGAGGGDIDIVDCAIQHSADCLITSEVKHHVAVYAVEKGFTIIEGQHFCTEYPYVAVLVDKIADKTKHLNTVVVQSQYETSPYTYIVAI